MNAPDGLEKSPPAALRCILRHCDVHSYVSFLRICAPCIWTFFETVRYTGIRIDKPREGTLQYEYHGQ